MSIPLLVPYESLVASQVPTLTLSKPNGPCCVCFSCVLRHHPSLMFTNGASLALELGAAMPRCCEHSSVSFLHGQRIYCLFEILDRPVFSEVGVGPFRLSFQAGVPKVQVTFQLRCFTPLHTLQACPLSSPAKPTPRTQKEVRLRTLDIFLIVSVFPHPHTPISLPQPYLFSFFMRGFCYLVGEGMSPDPVTPVCLAPQTCQA